MALPGDTEDAHDEHFQGLIASSIDPSASALFAEWKPLISWEEAHRRAAIAAGDTDVPAASSQPTVYQEVPDSLATEDAQPQASTQNLLLGSRSITTRLQWVLGSSIEQSIFVIPEGQELHDVSGLQPFFTDSGTHAVADELVTTVPTTSIVVKSAQISYHYVGDWVDEHYDHDWVEDRELAAMTEQDQDSDGSIAGDEEDEDGQPLKLIRCCGIARPNSNISPPTVHASDPSRGVTVLDYVLVVHPWLMSNQPTYRAALEMLGDELPDDARLFVSFTRPDEVSVEREQDRLAFRPTRLNASMSGVTHASIE